MNPTDERYKLLRLDVQNLHVMMSTSHTTSKSVHAHAPYTLTRSSMGLKLFSPGEPAGSPNGISAMRFQVSGSCGKLSSF